MRDSFLGDHRECAGRLPSGDQLQGVDVPAYEAGFLVTGGAGRSMQSVCQAAAPVEIDDHLSAGGHRNCYGDRHRSNL